MQTSEQGLAVSDPSTLHGNGTNTKQQNYQESAEIFLFVIFIISIISIIIIILIN